MENKTKILIITNVITAILVLALGGYIIFDKVNNDVPEEDNKNSNGSLYYSNSTEDNKIYLTDDNVVKLVSNTIGTKELAQNISWIHEIHAGQSDICEGNSWLILKGEENKFSALSIDTLSCGNKIRIIDLSGEFAKRNINNIESIYNTQTFINQFEPLSYKVYALDASGKSTEITDIFSE